MKNFLTQFLFLSFLFFSFSTLVFANDEITYSHLTNGYWQIWVMDDDGENKRQVTISPSDKRSPTWVNFGTQIAFRDSNSRLFLVNKNSPVEHEILQQYNNISEANFNDTTQEIVFIRFDPTIMDRNQIWKTNLLGNNAIILTNNSLIKFSPQFSVDGSKIVFSKKTENRLGSTIWIMNADGSSQKQVTSNTNMRDSMPDISPDMNWIVYSSNRTGNYEINLINLKTNTIKNISNNSEFDAYPRFSKNANNIVFVSDRSGNRQIWKMNKNGSDLKQLTSDDEESTEPSIKR